MKSVWSLYGYNALLLYCYDANGNVSDMIATDGTTEAHYEYDPFGNTIAAYGDSAEANPFPFSTKYFDDEVDLYYYGQRYYKPGLARWLSRDPIWEQGGYNLYGFTGNGPTYTWDSVGLRGTSDAPSSGYDRTNGPTEPVRVPAKKG